MVIELVKKLEHVITLVLIALLCVIVVLATAEVAVRIGHDILAPPLFFPGIDKLLDLFGSILLVVVGLELVETMRHFAAEGVVRVEIVLVVAVVALARRIVILEPGGSPWVPFAIAALLVAVSLAYRAFVPRR